MKTLARAALRIVMLGVPAVIAACYGGLYKYGASGTVVDKDTKQGIEGIRVDCILKSGSVQASDVTGAYGSFFVEGNEGECESLKATDTYAGDAGRPLYRTVTVAGTTSQIEMTKQDQQNSLP